MALSSGVEHVLDAMESNGGLKVGILSGVSASARVIPGVLRVVSGKAVQKLNKTACASAHLGAHLLWYVRSDFWRAAWRE